MNIAAKKEELRRNLFAELKTYSLGDRNRAAKKVCGTLSCLPAVKSARVVAAYIALKSELKLETLIQSAPPGDKGTATRFAVSCVNAANELDFYLLDGTDHLIEGAHGFLEPDPRRCEPADPAEIDVVLTPGVAFDPVSFARLGRGKGHYDRFLEKLRASRCARDTPLTVLGVAYQRQLVDVPCEEHDQPMNGLVTEQGFRQTPNGR